MNWTKQRAVLGLCRSTHALIALPFAKALLEVTKPEMLLEGKGKRKLQVDSAAVKAMFEEETDSLMRDLKAVEESYGTDILTLSIACGYIARLLANNKVERL